MSEACLLKAGSAHCAVLLGQSRVRCPKWGDLSHSCYCEQLSGPASHAFTANLHKLALNEPLQKLACQFGGQQYLPLQRSRQRRRVISAANADGSSSSEESPSEDFRQQLNDMMARNDAKFTGEDLAALIREKYGKSYDVTLIRKNFMGKVLLAMNVMWKFQEQRSFPLTEEEYILRLDDVAYQLREWGAVSLIQESLAKTKERPRIGKAVSILIDSNSLGGRSDEWK